MPLEDFGTEKEIETDMSSDISLILEPEEVGIDYKGKKESDLSQWSLGKSSVFYPSYSTRKTLPSGYYEIDYCQERGLFFDKKKLEVDELIEFPDSLMDSVLKEIHTFWEKDKEFQHYGFLHKRGIMLYGRAGSGKTCLIQLIMKKLIERNGIIVSGDIKPKLLTEGLNALREIEPHRYIICLFEDMDALIRKRGEEEILSILDGEISINHVLNLATTNYPEKLDKRIVARPRRFDRLFHIESPSAEMRRIYFAKKLKIEGEELEKYVEATQGFSFAGLCELVISVKCLGNSFDKSIKILKDLMENNYSSDAYYGSKTGFRK